MGGTLQKEEIFMNGKIESLENPKKVHVNLPESIISQRAELKNILAGGDVFLFGRIPQKGLCLIGNAGCPFYQPVLEKYVTEN